MDLENTLKQYVRQLENHPRTLQAVISVCRRIIATLYETYFPRSHDTSTGSGRVGVPTVIF